MSSQHPDFKWIEQLHFGNEEAYRILFDEYYQMLGVFASIKTEVLQRLFKLNIPFAMLVGVVGLIKE